MVHGPLFGDPTHKNRDLGLLKNTVKIHTSRALVNASYTQVKDFGEA
jgi:hypothetical protein